MKLSSNALAVVVPTVAAALSSNAMAAAGAAIDVTDTVGTITAQLAPIGLIGAAVLGIAVAIKGYHWVRRAMS